MWTNENRGRYDRSDLRYPSDLTDEEWALIGPLIPPAKTRRQQAQGEPAGSRQCVALRAQYWLPMAGDPEGLAAALHSLSLFRLVGLGWHAHAHP